MVASALITGLARGGPTEWPGGANASLTLDSQHALAATSYSLATGVDVTVFAKGPAVNERSSSSSGRVACQTSVFPPSHEVGFTSARSIHNVTWAADNDYWTSTKRLVR